MKTVVAVKRFIDQKQKTVRYKLPSQPLDDIDTLERDGLIKPERDKRGKWISTWLLAPDNIRVMLWVRSINETCRLQGVPEMFAGFDKGMWVVDAEPEGWRVNDGGLKGAHR
jgi:hypothetical protein